MRWETYKNNPDERQWEFVAGYDTYELAMNDLCNVMARINGTCLSFMLIEVASMGSAPICIPHEMVGIIKATDVKFVGMPSTPEFMALKLKYSV